MAAVSLFYLAYIFIFILHDWIKCTVCLFSSYKCQAVFIFIYTQASTSKSLSRAQQRKLAGGNGTKQSPTTGMPTKGSVRQRLHPGLLSSQDRATAHYGAVTGLKLTEDGMYLLSAGWFF